MELTETIDTLNRQLREHFGIDSITSLPIWRIVFSEDQYEKRLMEFSDGGVLLLAPEVRLVKKYSQWINKKYVLERLVLVPEVNKDELPVQKLSYEPIWVFQDSKGSYLPPKFEASKFVIDAVYAALGKSSLAKYKDPEVEEGANERRVDNIQEELYGEETDVTDALRRGEAIVVPPNYQLES